MYVRLCAYYAINRERLEQLQPNMTTRYTEERERSKISLINLPPHPPFLPLKVQIEDILYIRSSNLEEN